MAIYSFEGKCPAINDSAYIHPSASVIGDVEIGPHCFIGPGAVIRADFARISIGAGSAVEDNCVLHVEPDGDMLIGDHVIIGHGTIVHGRCAIKDHAIIGMGSLINSGCEIGSFGFLAAGSVLLQGQTIPNNTLAAGNPAQLKKSVDEKLRQYMDMAQTLYGQIAARYLQGVHLITP